MLTLALTMFNFVTWLPAYVLGIALSVLGLGLGTGNPRISPHARRANAVFLWATLLANVVIALLDT